MQKNMVAYPEQSAARIEQQSALQQSNTQKSTPVQLAYTDNITQQTLQSVSEAISYEQQALAASLRAIPEETVATLRPDAGKEAVTIDVMSPAFASKVAKRNAAELLPANPAAANDIAAVQTPIVQGISKPASMYFSTIGLMNLADLKKPFDSQPTAYNNEDIWRTYPLLSTKDLLRKKLSKFNFQFYITPSISYRILNDGNGRSAKSYTAFPVASNYQIDFHHIVKHRAAMGAEVGAALGYKLTNTLTIKGGLQFNVRQYDIKAYTISQPAAQILPASTENLAGANSITGQVTTDDAYLTSADNAPDVSKPVVLSNRYYEIAAPIGLDWQIVAAGKNLTVNIAAAAQPTYTFDKEPFVMTTNLKNYTDGTSLMRNWNLNSNVEAYVSYKIGAYRWQLGPQFRYQHFSTYSNAYPIREHLLDYGIKLGFTKSLD